MTSWSPRSGARRRSSNADIAQKTQKSTARRSTSTPGAAKNSYRPSTWEKKALLPWRSDFCTTRKLDKDLLGVQLMLMFSGRSTTVQSDCCNCLFAFVGFIMRMGSGSLRRSSMSSLRKFLAGMVTIFKVTPYFWHNKNFVSVWFDLVFYRFDYGYTSFTWRQVLILYKLAAWRCETVRRERPS